MVIKNFSQAISYLHQAVPRGSKRFPGNLGLDRQKEILRLLGNPQNKIKTIHVAGTSGKGSTSFYLSSLLIDQGFTVGLTLSPHLLDIRERFQINNRLIPKKEFIFYLNQIISVIEKIKTTPLGQPTFFEILIALAFYLFYQKKVDYAVIETGLGGLMDGSNVINNPNKVVILTKIGLDHTSILGSNLSLIAAQKAGIIHPQTPCFSIDQKPVVRKVFNQAALRNQTSINYLNHTQNITHIHPKNFSLIYNFKFSNLHLKSITLNTIGLYQIDNSALALTVLQFLSVRDNFSLNLDLIYYTLLNYRFPGRVDCCQINSKLFIFDGAHNPQKMIALVKSLQTFFPKQKFTFLLAFKQRKDFAKMIKMIVPIANQIILTKFKVTSQDMLQLSQSHLSLNQVFSKLNFSNFQSISNPIQAFNQSLNSPDPVVITGSLYLLGEIYPLLNSLR